MTNNDIGLLETPELITRREAVLRVTALLGGIALTGGTALITGCRQEKVGAPFTSDEIAYLDEIADVPGFGTSSAPGWPAVGNLGDLLAHGALALLYRGRVPINDLDIPDGILATAQRTDR